MKLSSLVLLAVTVLVASRCEQRSEKVDSDKSAYRNIYDAEADAEQDIRAALIRADKRDTRVLLIFGVHGANGFTFYFKTKKP